MKKFNMFILFMAFIPLVCANTNVYQEGNAGLNLSGSQGMGAYYSNIVNNVDNITYETCLLPGSVFTPVAHDFTRDGEADILITTLTSIRMYDLNCNFIAEIETDDTPRAPPVILDRGEDIFADIYFINGSEFFGYEYSPGNQSFVNQQLILYTILNDNLDTLTCGQYEALTGTFYCLSTKRGQDDTYYFNASEPSASLEVNVNVAELDNNMHSVKLGSNGLPSTLRTGTANSQYTIIPTQGVGGAQTIKLNVIDELGEKVGSEIEVFGASSFDITKFNSLNSFVATVEGLQRIFFSSTYEKSSGATRGIAKAWDLDGNELHSSAVLRTANRTSNWAIGDFQKLGYNQACYLINDSRYSTMWFRCFDSDFTLLLDLNFTNVLNMTTSLAIADFNGSEDTLGIATVEGIFYTNSTHGYKWVDSGYSGIRNGSGTIITSSTEGSPYYIYQDYTLGFILRNPSVNEACGNGYCDLFENAFSCPVDCAENASSILNQSGDPCTRNEDCLYGVCEYNFCALGGSLKPCDVDNDCISGNCKNDKCTKPSYWDNLDAAKDQQFGDDSDTNNFIALTIIMVIAGLIMISGRNLWATIGGIAFFVAGATFFAVVGWLSGFILLGIYLVLLIGIVFSFMLGGSSD